MDPITRLLHGYHGLNAHSLGTQQAAVQALTSGALASQTESWLRDLGWFPPKSPEQYGQFGSRSRPAHAPDSMDYAWTQQGRWLMLAATRAVFEHSARVLDQVTSLSITTGPASSGVHLDLSALEHMPNLERLELIGAGSVWFFGPVYKLTKLRELRLQRCKGAQDLSGFRAMPSLQKLILASELGDFGDVQRFESLKALVQEDDAPASIAPLCDLASIEHLHLGPVKDGTLLALSRLKTLKRLRVGSNRALKLRALDGLEALEALEALDVSGHPITSLAPLAGCPFLTELRVAHASIDSFAGLDLSQLSQLDASYTDIESLDALRGGRWLTALEVRGCARLSSLNGISGATRLRALDLSGCVKVNSLGFLGRFTQLESLTLRPGERITSLDALAGCTALTELFLDGCSRVTDLSALAKLTKLKRLSLRGSGASDLSALKALNVLETLDLRDCEALTEPLALTSLNALRRVALAGSGVPRTALAGLATWSETEQLDGHPEPARTTIAPRGTGSHTRKVLASVRKLLASPDLDNVAQGIELLSSLEDPSLFDMLLAGVTHSSPAVTDRLERGGGTWTVNRVFATRLDQTNARDHAIAMTLSAAPAESAVAQQIIAQATNVQLTGVGKNPARVDASALKGLRALQGVTLQNGVVDKLESLSALPALSALCLWAAQLPDGALDALPASLRHLRIESSTLSKLELVDALALRSLWMDNCFSLSEVSVRGCSALQLLSLSTSVGVQKVRLDALAELETLAFRAPSEINDLSVDGVCPKLKHLTWQGRNLDALRRLLSLAPALERLNLAGAEVTDLDFLTGHPTIKSVQLHWCRKLVNVVALGTLPRLERIEYEKAYGADERTYKIPAALASRAFVT